MATCEKAGQMVPDSAEVAPTCRTAASSSTFSAWLCEDSWS